MRRRSFQRRCRAALIALLVLAHANSTLAYLKFGFEVNGRQRVLKWTSTPVRYFVNDQDVPSVDAVEFKNAVSRAFATWESVPTTSIWYTFAGLTRNVAGEDDGRSTLGFVDQPELDRVLASTSFLVDGLTGELIESDVVFNLAFSWSVAPSGERNRWDVETIALHEIGHVSGLGHSAIGETENSATGRRVLSTGAVMFPIALGAGDVSNRRLSPDDIAGISDLYPSDAFNDVTGSVSGRVTKNGRGVFGAHVVAFDPGSGEMVGNFTLSINGQFSISGLRPGPHVVRIEPLDDADTESFFDPAEPVDVDFRIKYHERLLVVPRGGDSGTVEISVSGK